MREALEKELDAEIAELRLGGRALVKVRFLVLRCRYTPKLLKAAELLEDEYEPSVFYPGSTLVRWWRARRHGGFQPSHPSPIEDKASPIVVATGEPADGEPTEVEAETVPAHSEERAKEAAGGVSSA